MELQAFQYIQGKGWSIEDFPLLDSEQTLLLVFAAPIFYERAEPIRELVRFYPHSKIIGCSSAGEIFGPCVLDNSLSVVVVKFAHTPLKIVKALVNKMDKNSFQTGKHIAEQLSAPDLRGIFVLSDGLSVNGSELVQGLNHAKGIHPIITGGLAGDGSRFLTTWTIFNDEILVDQVVAVGFYGEHIQISHASQGGWDIFGPARRITYSEGNILYELDNQPALQLYKNYLGELANELPASGLLYPLAIHNPDCPDPVTLVRTILGVDEQKQSLIFAGDVPTGYHAQLMRANFDRLITSASDAGEEANKSLFASVPLQEEAILCVGVSCVGRRLLLGQRTEEETEIILETLPSGTIQVGFYSYGELSPVTEGNCQLHNQTMTLTLYRELE